MSIIIWEKWSLFSSNLTYDLIQAMILKWEKYLYRCLRNNINLVQNDLNEPTQDDKRIYSNVKVYLKNPCHNLIHDSINVNTFTKFHKSDQKIKPCHEFLSHESIHVMVWTRLHKQWPYKNWKVSFESICNLTWIDWCNEK